MARIAVTNRARDTLITYRDIALFLDTSDVKVEEKVMSGTLLNIQCILWKDGGTQPSTMTQLWENNKALSTQAIFYVANTLNLDRVDSTTNNLINDEIVYEMNHIWTADMKSSEAMIFAVMTIHRIHS